MPERKTTPIRILNCMCFGIHLQQIIIVGSYHPFEEGAEDYEINSIKIKVSSFLKTIMEKFIRQIIEEGNIHIEKQRPYFYSGLDSSFRRISQYKELVKLYPDHLKEEMVLEGILKPLN
ncbi:hypothetical protein [Neobacillus terrae]|uniref:hypothetical protein n=1 Tax=Neobacillus terrae TaxID=3034837 RepID=UPI00140B9C17|nr:hypothetical protein [Neobacillus terrae]NHM32629.1 hypothetical protein [Neobacillus terrae]